MCRYQKTIKFGLKIVYEQIRMVYFKNKYIFKQPKVKPVRSDCYV